MNSVAFETSVFLMFVQNRKRASYARSVSDKQRPGVIPPSKRGILPCNMHFHRCVVFQQKTSFGLEAGRGYLL